MVLLLGNVSGTLLTEVRRWFALRVTGLDGQQQAKWSKRLAKPCIRFWSHFTALQVSHFCFLRCKFYDSVRNNMYSHNTFLKISPNERRLFAWPQQFTPKNTDCVGEKYIPKEDSNSKKNKPRNRETLLTIFEHGLRGKDGQLYCHTKSGMVQTFVSFMSWITVLCWFNIFELCADQFLVVARHIYFLICILCWLNSAIKWWGDVC